MKPKDKRKKISMIIENPLFYGGGENHVFEISRILSQKGFEIEIIQTCGKIKFDTITNVRNACSLSHNSKLSEIYRIFAIPRTIKLCSNADIIHIHGICYLSLLISAFLLKKLKHKKIICTLHMRPANHKKLLTRVLLNKFDYLIAVSGQIKEEYRQIYNPNLKIEIIPNGIDISRFNESEYMDIIKKYNIHSKYILLSLGRLIEQKGLNYLIAAMPDILKNMDNDVCLIIAGEGPLKDTLIRQAQKLDLKEAIKFIGRVPTEELTSLYRSCDLFVVPSIYEPFGLTILEAMSQGKPVIASSVGGINEIIDHGFDGILIPPASVNALIDSIINILQNDKKRIEFGEHAKNKATKFSWNDVCNKLSDIYIQI